MIFFRVNADEKCWFEDAREESKEDLYEHLKDEWRSENVYIIELEPMVCIYDDTFEGPYDDSTLNRIASQIAGEDVHGPAAIVCRKEDHWIADYEADENYTSLSTKTMNVILAALLHKA